MTNKYQKIAGTHGEYRTSPVPSQDELDAFYRDVYYGSGVTATYAVTYTEDEMTQKRLRASATLEAIGDALPDSKEKPRILEIGAGEGFVLNEGKQRSLDIVGVDYQTSPVEKFNSDIIDLFVEADPNAFLAEKIAQGTEFDAVVLQNVLEHVRDPDKLLAEIGTILSPDGVLLVQVPNDFSALQALAMEQGRIEEETWFAPPQHLTYWNTECIGPYMNAQGYQIVDGFADFPIEMYLWGGTSNYVLDRENGPFAHKARVTLDLFASRKGLGAYMRFCRSLFEIGLGRNMAVVLRKTEVLRVS